MDRLLGEGTPLVEVGKHLGVTEQTITADAGKTDSADWTPIQFETKMTTPATQAT